MTIHSPSDGEITCGWGGVEGVGGVIVVSLVTIAINGCLPRKTGLLTENPWSCSAEDTRSVDRMVHQSR